jgi:hypothetical protein
MHEMTKHYLICALWAETDESNDQGGDPLDENYGIEDFAPEAVEQAERDCMKFLLEHSELISGRYTQAGYDFWFTRRGHGSGFWDVGRPWGKAQGRLLSDAAQKYQEVNVVVGDDNKLYFE